MTETEFLTEIISVPVTPTTLSKIEQRRGMVPRAAFIREIIDGAMKDE